MLRETETSQLRQIELDELTVASRNGREHVIDLREVSAPRARVEAARAGGIQRGLKRAVDVVLSAAMLLVSAPVFLAIALAIKADDRGPVFYRQERWGYRGQRFKVLKFRSMVVNADPAGVARQAAEDDGRVTRAGRLLRRTGLDELPQLLNILKGDMSFVGPRALAVDERLDHAGNSLSYNSIPGFVERMAVRPGLTGMATIYLPKDAPPAQKFEQDVAYVASQSVWLDLRLIVLSFWISFRGKWETRDSKF